MKETYDAEDEELRYALGLEYLKPLDLASTREDHSLQLRSYKEYADQFLDSLPQSNKARLRFAFLDTNDINGKALQREVQGVQVRFATVSAGAILYFHEFFSYLMSRVDILPEIGIATSEKNLPYHFTPSRSYSPTKWLRERRLIHIAIPQNPSRLEFSSIMAVTASTFLILHEIAHCVNGHLSQSSLSLDEVDGPAATPSDGTLHIHTLEMDADAYATSQMFGFPSLFKRQNDSFTWSKGIGYPCTKWLYPSMVALWLVFRIMSWPERLGLDQMGLLNSKHPHPAVRAHFCRVIIRRLGIERCDPSVEHWLVPMLVKSSFDASNIWKSVTGRDEPDRLLYFDDISRTDGFERVRIYANQLLDHWSRVKADLQPMALVPLPATKEEEVRNGYQCPCSLCKASRGG